MGQILDTALDTEAYAGIAALLGITATAEEIDKNPLFGLAETFIIGLLPGATDRSNEDRPEIVQALTLLAPAYILRGGGSVGSTTVTQGSGEVRSRSETIDGVTVREDYDVGSRASVSRSEAATLEDRADFLEAEALKILSGLGASTPSTFDLEFGIENTRPVY